jgi:leucyl/phenylalanyl-tRNA--protein transferase
MQIIHPELILEAYSQGYFPMGKDGSDSEVEWYGARKRGVFPLDTFHMPSRALRYIRTKAFEFRTDTDFAGVLSGCADRETTWINQTIFDTYLYLHQAGYAHSVEVWRDGKLVGGLYGLVIGGAFFAESVYQTEPEAMKAALFFCHQHLVRRGFLLWDVQFLNSFLAQFGCRELRAPIYMKRLNLALERVDLSWSDALSGD